MPFDPARLQSQLQVIGFQQSNPPHYQLLFQIIEALKQIYALIAGLSGGSSGGGGSTTTIIQKKTVVVQQMMSELMNNININQGSSDVPPSSMVDHVVMSDGATPIPEPVNDGFGNFIYISYTP